jgi:hypothetical protein
MGGNAVTAYIYIEQSIELGRIRNDFTVLYDDVWRKVQVGGSFDF